MPGDQLDRQLWFGKFESADSDCRPGLHTKDPTRRRSGPRQGSQYPRASLKKMVLRTLSSLFNSNRTFLGRLVPDYLLSRQPFLEMSTLTLRPIIEDHA